VKFKAGDLVAITNADDCGELAQWVRAGMCGEIIGFYGLKTHVSGLVYPYWNVLVDGVRLFVSENVLRKIPGDTEGRKTVEWDWRSLTEKRPEMA
jgi:hypothetical protein